MRILVTGHKGFIGQNLCNDLRSQGHEVIGVDKEDGDLRKAGVMQQHLQTHRDLDYVVHLAAKVGRLFGEDDPHETIADNAGMTALVAQACGDHGVRLAYASTSEIYGDLGLQMCFETVEKKLPHNIYGLSKR